MYDYIAKLYLIIRKKRKNKQIYKIIKYIAYNNN